MNEKSIYSPDRVSTGIEGLDRILRGGLPRHHLYLLEGESGTGKTTTALEFLIKGRDVGEKCLYVTLSETIEELKQTAASHGWSLDGVELYEVTAAEAAAQLAADQTIFQSADIELTEVTDGIICCLNESQPDRVVFDSITEIRLLANDPLRYRRQILNLRKNLSDLGATALFLSNDTPEQNEEALHSLVHGVIELEQRAPDYGDTRRRLQVTKLRGSPYRQGYHDFEIRTGGLEVFPRLHLAGGHGHKEWQVLKSGVPELDNLLGGGLETGTALLLAGPTGVGKTVLATLYAYTAAKRGEKTGFFIFDERLRMFFRRAEGLGMDIEPFVEQGLVTVEQINTGEVSPGEFADRVRRIVDAGTQIVVIDSLTGYVNAMPEERLLLTQLHELLTYLSQKGVLTILVISYHGILSTDGQEPVAASYLADTIILLRHFEAGGAVRQAISVVKQRNGQHEKLIREFRVTPNGIIVGQPLVDFSGVLTGTPVFEGERHKLLELNEKDEYVS